MRIIGFDMSYQRQLVRIGSITHSYFVAYASNLSLVEILNIAKNG